MVDERNTMSINSSKVLQVSKYVIPECVMSEKSSVGGGGFQLLKKLKCTVVESTAKEHRCRQTQRHCSHSYDNQPSSISKIICNHYGQPVHFDRHSTSEQTRLKGRFVHCLDIR